VGVRYIAPCRPGVGGSDPQPGRTILDYPQDVRALADALELERFDVIGVSAGGPYALAVAHELPQRVGRLALCSALSPFSAPHRTPGLRRRVQVPLSVLAGAPAAVSLIGDLVLPLLAAHPAIVTAAVALHAAPSERLRLRGGAEQAAVCRSFLDATATHGTGGLVEDFLTYVGGWGFDPADVQHEVHLWHGAKDPLVPVEHALQLAATLPRCTVSVDPDEGHHFFRSALPQILSALVAPQPPVRPADRRASV
jgi:pimeloyl-ACP methyl ester carboxylesterase